MKKPLICLLVLLFSLTSAVAAETNVEIGTQANFQLTDQTEIGLLLGMQYDSSQSEENSIAPLLGTTFSYKIDQANPTVHIVLNAEKRRENINLYGQYAYPIHEKFNLKFGLGLETVNSTPESSVLMGGDWQVGPGLLDMEITMGNRHSLGAEYRLQKKVLSRVTLTGTTGLVWVAGNQEPEEVNVPLNLVASVDLTDSLRLKLASSTALNLKKDPVAAPVTIGFYLESDFDLTKSEDVAVNQSLEFPEIAYVKPAPAEERKVVQTENISTEAPKVEVKPVPVEVIPVEVVRKERTEEPTVPLVSETRESLKSEPTVPVAAEAVPMEPEPIGLVYYYDSEKRVLYTKKEKIQIDYWLNGELVYLPLRETIEKMGGQVFWYDNPQQICIVVQEVKIFMDLEEEIYLRNGSEIVLKEALHNLNGFYFIESSDLKQMVQPLSGKI